MPTGAAVRTYNILLGERRAPERRSDRGGLTAAALRRAWTPFCFAPAASGADQDRFSRPFRARGQRRQLLPFMRSPKSRAVTHRVTSRSPAKSGCNGGGRSWTAAHGRRRPPVAIALRRPWHACLLWPVDQPPEARDFDSDIATVEPPSRAMAAKDLQRVGPMPGFSRRPHGILNRSASTGRRWMTVAGCVHGWRVIARPRRVHGRSRRRSVRWRGMSFLPHAGRVWRHCARHCAGLLVPAVARPSLPACGGRDDHFAQATMLAWRRQWTLRRREKSEAVSQAETVARGCAGRR